MGKNDPELGLTVESLSFHFLTNSCDLKIEHKKTGGGVKAVIDYDALHFMAVCTFRLSVK